MKTVCWQLTTGVLLAVGWMASSQATAPCRAATVAYWKFDSQATLQVDSAGSNTLGVGSGVSVTPGGVGDPSSGYATFAGGADGSNTALHTYGALDLSGYTQLTIEFFVKSDNITATQVLYELSPDFNSNSGGLIAYTGVTDLTSGYMSTNSYVEAAPISALTDKEWHHVAFQYDASQTLGNPQEDRMKIFVDYNQVGGNVSSHSFPLDAPFDNDTFFIGSRNYSFILFKGSMDEFRISDQLLSPNEFVQFSQVPEPASLALGLVGLLGLAAVRRSRG